MQPPPNGVEFATLPRTSLYGDGAWPCWAQRFELLPRNVWVPINMNGHVHTIYSQLDGMCTSNGACGAVMAERSWRGMDHLELSPEHLYGLHSKWGSGSGLDENLKALTDFGVCDRATVAQDDWKPRDWPDDWKTFANKNRVLEFIDLNGSFEAVATAIMLRKPCVMGVHWPGGGGHAVAVTQLAMDDDHEWCLRGPNSWGSDWGEKGNAEFSAGFYTLKESEISGLLQFGAWAVGASTALLRAK